MKLNQDTPIKEEELTEEIRQVQQKKQTKFIGTIKPHKGHTVWEIHLQTGMVVAAEFDQQAIDYSKVKKGQTPANKKITAKENCKYVPALNKLSAIRKYVKQGVTGKPEFKAFILKWLLAKNGLKDKK